MDISKDIQVYDTAANSQNASMLKPSVDIVKKRFPSFSQSKARQHTLWDEETKTA